MVQTRSQSKKQPEAIPEEPIKEAPKTAKKKVTKDRNIPKVAKKVDLPDSLDAPDLSKEQEEALKHLYFEEKNFFGRDKIYKLINKVYPNLKISRRQVMRFLAENELSQLYQKKEKKKDIEPTVLSKSFSVLGVDLKDMQNQAYDGYNWLMVTVDLFSKFIWVEPMKSKDDEESTRAMKKILGRMKRDFKNQPSAIRSDNGSEFKGKFASLLKSKKIAQVFSKPNTPQSNGQAERSVGIISRLLAMNKTHTDDDNWVKAVQKLVFNYNNVEQRTIKMSPMQAIQQEYNPEIKDNIKKEVTPKNYDPKDTSKFTVNSKVRIQLNSNTKEKLRFNWSEELYTITKILKSKVENRTDRYKVADEDGNELDGTFLPTELQLIREVKNPIESRPKYNVSFLVQPRMRKDGNQYIKEYLVHWKGYKVSERTYEPRDELMNTIPKMIKTFEAKHKVEWEDTSVTWDRKKGSSKSE